MSAAARSPEPSALVASIGLLAANYKSSGNGERAEGLMQAAAMIDMEGYRMSGRSLVEALDVMLRSRLEDYVADVVAAVLDALDKRSGAPLEGVDLLPPKLRLRRPGPPRDASPAADPRRLRPVAARVPAGGPQLGAGARKVLAAIAQHPAGVSRAQLTVLTGYKKSTRDLYLQQLLQHRFAVRQDEDLVATDAGIRWLGPDYQKLPTGSALRLYWCNELPDGEGRVLAFVCKFYPHTVSSERISQETGYRKSTRDLYLQRLVARRLLEKTGPGHYCAAALLFDDSEVRR